MNENKIYGFNDAASTIKDAIIRSRYQAAKLVNKELLSLYYAVGRYVSQNSRENVWGQGALKHISEELQRELPGLRGFSETSIKKMRLFFEGWQAIFTNRPLLTDDLALVQNPEDKQADINSALTVITAINTTLDLSLLFEANLYRKTRTMNPRRHCWSAYELKKNG